MPPKNLPPAEESSSECIRRCKPQLRSIVLPIIRDESELDDILSELSLRAWKAMRPPNPEAWLATVARRLAVDRFRQKRRAAKVMIPLLEGDQFALEGVTREFSELLHAVETLVDQLPTPQRDVIVGYFFENRTLEQLAEDLHISKSTVHKRVSATLKKLREEISREIL